jgi:hypothetical protein
VHSVWKYWRMFVMRKSSESPTEKQRLSTMA